MNWKRLGIAGLISGLSVLYFASECSREIARREARTTSQPTTRQMQSALYSSLYLKPVAEFSDNVSYYNKHEVEIYHSFGGREKMYSRLGWEKDKVLSEREKAAIANLYRNLGTEGMGSFGLK